MGARVILLAVLAGCMAAPTTVNAEETTTGAQAAPLDKQPDAYLRAAQMQLKAADEFYNAGKIDEARTALDSLVTNSDKATEAASRSHKHLKSLEIDLRKMSEHLRDLKGTLNLEDQPPVQTVIDHLEGLRTKLLDLMFGKNK